MAYEPDVSELRKNMEIARDLTKHRIGFVIMAAKDHADYVNLLTESAKRFDELALEAENANQS